jgi:LDH2 family malate/lactate/ureidoglycolate dehydrogenase
MIANITELTEVAQIILESNGVSADDAEIVINHLLDEELLGKHSHGFNRIPSIIKTIKCFNGKSTMLGENRTDNANRIMFENTLGIVAAYRTAQKAVDIAKQKGIAIVSAIGYEGTTGAIGYYGRLIAKEGYISIICCTSEYAVAPWGGKEAILGTNPIAVSFPNGDEPIVSDLSTAAMTYGDLMLAVKEGKEVQYGVVLDSDGKPSHNPNDANNGCQLPMAEHKGYALGLAVEILAGLFIGAKSGKDAVVGSDGIVMIVFKPELFVPYEQYIENLNLLVDEIKKSATAYGSSEIRIPGESSFEKINKGRKLGICELPDMVYQELINMRGND